MDYIVIDSGTTNTRIKYVSNEEIIAENSEVIGVKDIAITKDTGLLRSCIKKGIKKCLKLVGKNIDDVEAIIAYGMITSEHGLIHFPHICLPIAEADLSANIKKAYFFDICDKPIYFIPGTKNGGRYILNMDMMRGEETETIGLIDEFNIDRPTIYISPGSHTKYVFLDKNSNIVECATTITGELAFAIIDSTILASSLPDDLLVTIDKEYIQLGLEYVKQYGFTKSLFQVRTMDILGETTKIQRMNFLVAAICYNDIYSIGDELIDRDIVIGGLEVISELYKNIIRLMGYKNTIYTLNKKSVGRVGALGAIKLYNQYITRDNCILQSAL